MMVVVSESKLKKAVCVATKTSIFLDLFQKKKKKSKTFFIVWCYSVVRSNKYINISEERAREKKKHISTQPSQFKKKKSNYILYYDYK